MCNPSNFQPDYIKSKDDLVKDYKIEKKINTWN